MDYFNMNYLLLGMGISNIEIKKFFDKNKILYKIYDDKENKKITIKEIEKFNYIIKSPSVVLTHYIISIANKLNIKVISDLELFYLFKPNQKYLSITGSNGKTTVTYYLHQLLNQCNIKNYIAGNIGIPLFSIIDKIEEDDIIIIETSSYMLESIDQFTPLVHAITNIYQHHLDHHISYKNYFNAKIAPLKNNKTICLYPDDLKLIKNRTNNICFSFSDTSINSDFWIKNNIIFLKNKSYYINELNLFCKIDKLNLLTAFSIITILKCYYVTNIKIDVLVSNLKELKKYPFREEVVFSNNQCEIINDSKSTNYYATLAATKNLIGNEKYEKFYKILICGGKIQKNYNFSFKFLDYYNEMILYGENRNIIQESIKDNVEFNMFINLEEVINYLKNIRKKISNQKRLLILFSPMSASFDQYKSYIDRGEHFNKLINSIVDFL